MRIKQPSQEVVCSSIEKANKAMPLLLTLYFQGLNDLEDVTKEAVAY
jgi:hypothetical protein